MTFDERDLDALLRQPTERLAPPDGSWELVAKRARRRKWAKASASVTAGLLIIAGIVPAAIALRPKPGEQSVGIAKSPNGQSALPKSQLPNTHPAIASPSASSPSSTAAVPLSMAGFVPDSVSFISADTGYMFGTIGSSHAGVVAQTTDDGHTWTRLPNPPDVEDSASAAGVSGDNQIRFGSLTTGFIYGSLYLVSQDSGQSWTPYSMPGYIDDLEVMHDQVWALVRPSQDSQTVRLYSATTGDPTLRLVPGVSAMQSVPGADSIALSGNTVNANVSVNVIVGGSTFLTSPNGKRFHTRIDPCGINPPTGASAQNALLSTLDVGTVVAVCGYNVGGSGETKQAYISNNSGKVWTATAQAPSEPGSIETLGAGTGKAFILGTTHGAQITLNSGKTWLPAEADGIPLGFVGFIDLHHIVAISDRADSTVGAFATSRNSGHTWVVTQFPK
jgi:hypothetical protein